MRAAGNARCTTCVPDRPQRSQSLETEETCRTAWGKSHLPEKLRLEYLRHKIRHGGSAYGRSRRLYCTP